MERQAVTILKAAQMVGVSRRTIYNWLASGKLDYVRTAGGSVRIFVDSLWRDPVETVRSHNAEAHFAGYAGNVS